MAKKTTSKSAKSSAKTAAKPESKAPAKRTVQAAKAEAKPKGVVKQETPALTTAPVHNVAPTTDSERAAKAEPRPRDPRLPAPGTVLQKKDRQGNVRCECTIEEDGIRFKGTLYRSLSAAAMAASKDLGLGGRAQNGFLFFGLVKQPARASDPVAALEHAWERYRERLFSTVERVASEDMPRVQGAIEAHAKALGGFLQHSLASAK
jgi:hypothetical protein